MPEPKKALSYRDKSLFIIKVIISFLIVFLAFKLIFFGDKLFYNYKIIRVTSIAGIILLTVSLLSWKQIHGEFINAYTIYLIICYLFMYGQCFLWAFGLDVNNDLRDKFSSDQIIRAQVFTLFGLLFFHLGALFITTRSKYVSLVSRLVSKNNDLYKVNSLRKTGVVLFLISLIPFIINMTQKVEKAKSFGYGALYDFSYTRTHTSTLMDVLSSLLISAILCLAVGFNKNKIMKILILTIIMLIIMINLFIGTRFEAYSLTICILLIWLHQKKKVNMHNKIAIYLIILLLIQLIPIIRSFRNQDNRDIGDFIRVVRRDFFNYSYLIDGVSELGGSMFPLISTMEIVPSTYPYRLGKTYFFSFLTIVPNIGLWDVHIGYLEANVNDWLQNVLGLSYGPGYSMVAEAYINFGWLGLIFLFLLGAFIGGLLYLINKRTLNDKPTLYIIIIVFLYFSIITTRNSFVANIRALFYYSFPIYLTSKILSSAEKKNIHNYINNN